MCAQMHIPPTRPLTSNPEGSPKRAKITCHTSLIDTYEAVVFRCNFRAPPCVLKPFVFDERLRLSFLRRSSCRRTSHRARGSMLGCATRPCPRSSLWSRVRSRYRRNFGFYISPSASAVGSGQVLSEIEQAPKRRHPIYTILISKPTINRELDYYISRLHWIEQGGNSLGVHLVTEE